MPHLIDDDGRFASYDPTRVHLIGPAEGFAVELLSTFRDLVDAWDPDDGRKRFEFVEYDPTQAGDGKGYAVEAAPNEITALAITHWSRDGTWHDQGTIFVSQLSLQQDSPEEIAQSLLHELGHGIVGGAHHPSPASVMYREETLEARERLLSTGKVDPFTRGVFNKLWDLNGAMPGVSVFSLADPALDFSQLVEMQ